MQYSYIPDDSINFNNHEEVEELTYNQLRQVCLSDKYISVIRFYSNWSFDCKNNSVFYETYPKLYKNMRFFNINANLNDDYIIQCNICTLPTTQLFFKGEKLDEVVGNDPNALKNILKQYNVKK